VHVSRHCSLHPLSCRRRPRARAREGSCSEEPEEADTSYPVVIIVVVDTRCNSCVAAAAARPGGRGCDVWKARTGAAIAMHSTASLVPLLMRKCVKLEMPMRTLARMSTKAAAMATWQRYWLKMDSVGMSAAHGSMLLVMASAVPGL